MDYFLAGSLGGLIAFVFSIPALVLELIEKGKAKDAPLLVEVRIIFGLKIRHVHEVFFIGLLLHILIGFFFGFLYVYAIAHGFLYPPPYSLFSLLLYSAASWIFTNLAVYPGLGMGMFARREGPFIWLETLAAHLTLGTGFWFLAQYYQPWFLTL